MALIANKKTKILALSILYGILASIVILLTGYLAGATVVFLTGTLDDDVFYGNYIWITLIFVVMAFFVSRWAGNFLHKKLRPFDDELKNRFAKYLIFGASITLALFFVDVFMRETLDAVSLNTVYGLFLIVYFVFLVAAIFSFTDSFRKESELRHKDEMLKNLQAYTNNVEGMATEVRRFRHDHRNLLLGFREYIENDDTEKAKKYLQSYMSIFEENAAAMDSQLELLRNIKIPELKSILSFKLLCALELGIKVHIEVTEVIEDRPATLLYSCK